MEQDYDEFFNQSELASLKETSYVRNETIKRKNLFGQEGVMDSGNTCIFDGEQSGQYTIIKHKLDDIQKQEQDKEAQTVLKESLQNNESLVLSSITSSSGSVPSKRRRVDLIDAILIEILESRRKKNAPNNNICEENVELIMHQYCAKQGIDVQSIILKNQLSDEAGAIMTRLGLPTILNIYCTRGQRLDAQNFKNAMKEMGVPAQDYYSLFNHVD